jgi:hypothetical protein
MSQKMVLFITTAVRASNLIHFSTLKMEAICFSETFVDTQRTTRRYVLEDGTLHNHRCENLKSYTAKFMTGLSIPKLSSIFLHSKSVCVHLKAAFCVSPCSPLVNNKVQHSLSISICISDLMAVPRVSAVSCFQPERSPRLSL